MKHPPPLNQWQHPVYIKPARRVTSGTRVVMPIPLRRVVKRRGTVPKSLAMDAACVLLSLICLALLWRALIER